jgi:hypothetical protein
VDFHFFKGGEENVLVGASGKIGGANLQGVYRPPVYVPMLEPVGSMVMMHAASSDQAQLYRGASSQ